MPTSKAIKLTPWPVQRVTHSRCTSLRAAGDRVFTGHEDGTLLCWSFPNKGCPNPARLHKFKSKINDLAVDKTAEMLVLGISYAQQVTRVNFASGQTKDYSIGISDPYYIGLSSDGQKIFVADRDGGVQVLAAGDGQSLAHHNLANVGIDYQYACEFIPDEGLVVSGVENGVVIWEAETGKVLHRVALPLERCRFISGNRTILVSDHDASSTCGQICAIDRQTGKIIAQTVVGGLQAKVLTSSGTHVFLLTESNRGLELLAWDIASEEISDLFTCDEAFISPDRLTEVSDSVVFAHSAGIVQLGPLPKHSESPTGWIPPPVQRVPAQRPTNVAGQFLLSIFGKLEVTGEQVTAAQRFLQEQKWKEVGVQEGPLSWTLLTQSVDAKNVFEKSAALLAAAGLPACSVDVSLSETAPNDPDFETPPFFESSFKFPGSQPGVPTTAPAPSGGAGSVRAWVTFAEPSDACLQVRFSRDGRYAVCAGTTSQEVTWRDAESGKILNAYQFDEYPFATAIAPNGLWLAWGGDQVHVLDLQKKEFLKKFGKTHRLPAEIHSLDFSPSGHRLAVGGVHGLSIYSCEDGRPIGKHAGNAGYVVVRFVDEDRVLVADATRLLLRHVDEARPRIIYAERDAYQIAADIRVYPPLDRMFSCGHSGVFVWKAGSVESVGAIENIHCVAGAMVDADHIVVVVNGAPTRVELWRLRDTQRLAEWSLVPDASSMMAVYSIDASPNGKSVLVGHHRGVHRIELNGGLT